MERGIRYSSGIMCKVDENKKMDMKIKSQLMMLWTCEKNSIFEDQPDCFDKKRETGQQKRVQYTLRASKAASKADGKMKWWPLEEGAVGCLIQRKDAGFCEALMSGFNMHLVCSGRAANASDPT